MEHVEIKNHRATSEIQESLRARRHCPCIARYCSRMAKSYLGCKYKLDSSWSTFPDPHSYLVSQVRSVVHFFLWQGSYFWSSLVPWFNHNHCISRAWLITRKRRRVALKEVKPELQILAHHISHTLPFFFLLSTAVPGHLGYIGRILGVWKLPDQGSRDSSIWPHPWLQHRHEWQQRELGDGAIRRQVRRCGVGHFRIEKSLVEILVVSDGFVNSSSCSFKL